MSPQIEVHGARLPIETGVLTLRALRMEDTATVFRMSQEEGMRAWLPSQVYSTEQHAASVLEFLIAQYQHPADPRLGPYVLGIQRKGAIELIGHVGFSPFDEDVEVGFAVEDAHQGRGIATAAVRAACHWLLGAYSLPRILGIAAEGNPASQRVLLGAGFARERTEVMQFQGAKQTVVVHALEKRSGAAERQA